MTIYTLPAVHALHVAELAAGWGVARADVLAGLSVPQEVLSEPRARLPVAEIVDVIERARRLTGEPGLGFFLGLHMQIASHGYLGFAAMTASTVGEALALATRFIPTRTSALELELRVERGAAHLRVIERAELGAARDALIIALLVGIARLGAALTGRALSGRMELAFPEPAYVARIRAKHVALVSGPIVFDQAVNQLVFDAAILDVPMTNADPSAQRLVREQCEAELRALEQQTTVAARAAELLLSDDGVRSLEQVSQRLHISPRTLKRRLADDGTSYSELLTLRRRERALQLLRARELTVDEIAHKLGYSDPASFNRAFRRWMGRSPGAYRREQAAPVP